MGERPTLVSDGPRETHWAQGRFRASVWRSGRRQWMWRAWDVIDRSLGGSGSSEIGRTVTKAEAHAHALAALAKIVAAALPLP